MKKNKFFLLIMPLLITSWAIGQHVNIKVYNKTGYDLDSVSFDRIYLGKINNHDSVILSGIAEIIMQGDVPLYRPLAKIEGKKSPMSLKPCSTKSQKKKTGSYTFDLMIYEKGNLYRYYWVKHSH